MLHVTAEDLPVELVDLLLDEAERALLWVDARVDEPGRRLLDGLPADGGPLADGVPELRLAAAELIDGHPGIQYELERVADRVRVLGPSAALAELGDKPHLLDLARLSLETFFRLYPDTEIFEAEQESRGGDVDDIGRTPKETYAALVELMSLLRGRLS
ncbi:MAG: hypothetical protein U1E65_30310 [Myxococcota bacterium]